MKKCFWTNDGARLQHQSTFGNSNLHWLFLPGGPGLGSESLIDLTRLLANVIPGSIWLLDLPNDGSNILENITTPNWRSALLQAVSHFENVILVAHSSLGMYAQTMPELENILTGLVLMDSAPDASWQISFETYRQQHHDTNISAAEIEYTKNPNNDTLRNLLTASTTYSFVTKE